MRQIIKNKCDNLLRLILLKSVANKNNSILLTEYPKSGGSWLGEMLSELTGIEFPRNRFPSLKTQSIFHGHYLPKYGVQRNKKVICLVRDGRDVTVSYYFHQLFLNDKTSLNKKEIKYYTKLYGFEDVNDVKTNMPKFISHLNSHVPSKFFHFLFPGTWSEFYKQWVNYSNKNSNVLFVKYENLRLEPLFELKKILNFLEVENISDGRIQQIIRKHSFKAKTQRKSGMENRKSFMRKGIVGDWKNYFTQDAIKEFKKHGQEGLELLNYEQNDTWDINDQ